LQGGGIVNPTINLLDRLLSQGRRLNIMGRRVEARQRLDKLLAHTDAPAHQRVEAHQLLAEIHLDSQRYRKARRHLLAALGLQPECAETHYRLAMAIDLDPDGEPKRAAKHFRKALEHKPDEPRYWASYGHICLRLAKDKAAYGAFIAATDLAPNDVAVIDEITDGLCFLGKEEDARSVLTAARFRLGHDAELEQLWNRFRFLQLHRQQQAARRRKALAEGEAVILPYVPSKETSGPKGEPGILRHDRFSRPTPHATRPGISSDPRRVP
jgi:tetratricopeptide (TPR) repeat protein